MCNGRSALATLSVITLIGVGVGANSYAQEKYSINYSSPPDTSRYVRDDSIAVDDATGHKIRILEVQRTYTKKPFEVMGTKVVETWSRAFTDYINGAGPGHGYETWVLEDGSKIFLRNSFISSSETSPSGSRRGTAYSTARLVGGTGKYSGIQGTITTTAEFDTDPQNGYNRPSIRGEYWLAK